MKCIGCDEATSLYKYFPKEGLCIQCYNVAKKDFAEMFCLTDTDYEVRQSEIHKVRQQFIESFK